MKIVVSTIDGSQVHETLRLNMTDETLLSDLLDDIGEFLSASYEEFREEGI